MFGMRMAKFGRYNLSELSLRRLYSAMKVRLEEIPHALSWRYSSAARYNKERLSKLREIHMGERCFIVANGPSLRRTNLDFLKNEVTFGLNRIYVYFEEVSFRPTYYVAVNSLRLKQFSGEINNLDMPKFLNWNGRQYFSSHDNSFLFLKAKLVVNDFFQHELTEPMVFGATVTFAALQIAYYMGFQTAIIVGLDHNYFNQGTPSATEVHTNDQDETHFHPNYIPKGFKLQVPDLLRSEIDFQLARDAFERDGRQILDATIDGKCTIFEKVDYSSLFGKEAE